MGSEHTACLLLGSNIEPEHNLPLAVDQLQETPDRPADFAGLGNDPGGFSRAEFS